MHLGLIWAQSTSGIIGRAGGIPWHLPEDLARFKELTIGHPVVMGRLTWESLPEKVRPLPGRRNVVLTRDGGYRAPGADVVTSLEPDLDTAWVIGGAQIFAMALPFADRCEVTEVEVDLGPADGDVLAPALDDSWAATVGPWQSSRSGLRYRYHSYRR